MILAGLLLIATTRATAGVASDGFEFIVNTYRTGDQFSPVVASRGREGFLVLWTSFGQLPGNPSDDLFARYFDLDMMPTGTESLVNTSTAGDQTEGRIGSSGSGPFVHVWTDWLQGDGSSQGVIARRFDSGGLPLGSEFVVNAYTTGAQYMPDVSMNASGDFVVVWTDAAGLDGDGFGVFGRIFDSAGAVVGSEFQVNMWTTGAQTLPKVLLHDSGSFLAAWTDFSGEDGSGEGVFARLFDSAGGEIGSEIQVNESVPGAQSLEDVAGLPGGGFVVTWRDGSYLDGSEYGVFGRLLDSDGSPRGGQFQVNVYTTGTQRFSSAASDSEGRFVVVWTSTIQTGAADDLFGRRFDSDGVPLGFEFRVNTYTTGTQRIPEIAMDPEGNFSVVWTDGAVDGDGDGVIARHFFGRAPEMTSHRDGDPVDCSDPRNARPTFAWEADGYDRFRVFLGVTPGFVKGTRTSSGDGWLRDTAWKPPRKKWRNICLKATAVNPGNPILYVRVLGKDTDLPKKDPARKRFSGTIETVPEL